MEPYVSEVLNNHLLLYRILFWVDYDTVLHYCRTNTAFAYVCDDPVFWQQRAQEFLGIPKEIFHDPTMKPAERYLQLLTERGGIATGSEQYIDLDQFMRRAIRHDRDDLILYAINTLKFRNWDIPLYEYARKGNVGLVEFFLAMSPKHQQAAEGALNGGHTQVFDYIHALAPHQHQWDWNRLACAAISTGDQAIFDHVCHCAQIYGISLNHHHWDWNSLAQTALMIGNAELLEYILSLAPPHTQWHWTQLAAASLVSDDIKLFNTVLLSAPSDYVWDWNALAEAALTRNIQFFEYVYSLAPPDYRWNWTHILNRVILSGNRPAIIYLSKLIHLL